MLSSAVAVDLQRTWILDPNLTKHKYKNINRDIIRFFSHYSGLRLCTPKQLAYMWSVA